MNTMEELTPRSDVTMSEAASTVVSSDDIATPRSDTAPGSADETLEERIKRRYTSLISG